MNLQRRRFLSKAFEIGGLSALMSLGLSYKVASTFAGIQAAHKKAIARKNVEVGGEPTTISEDFSTNPIGTRWTAEIGTFVYDSGNENLDCVSSATGLLSHDTQLDTINQYVVVQYVSIPETSFAGIYFRFDGNTSNNAYAVRYEAAADRFLWRTLTGVTGLGDIEFQAHSLTIGDYVGITCTGTADSTIVKIWDFGVSPPGDPHDPSSWGAATYTFTNNPDSDKRADSGRYVGLYDGGTNAAVATFDNFSAGTFTP